MAGDWKCEEEDMKLDQIGFWSEIKLEIIKKYAGVRWAGDLDCGGIP
jgi:hypothetical protein